MKTIFIAPSTRKNVTTPIALDKKVFIFICVCFYLSLSLSLFLNVVPVPMIFISPSTNFCSLSVFYVIFLLAAFCCFSSSRIVPFIAIRRWLSLVFLLSLFYFYLLLRSFKRRNGVVLRRLLSQENAFKELTMRS